MDKWLNSESKVRNENYWNNKIELKTKTSELQYAVHELQIGSDTAENISKPEDTNRNFKKLKHRKNIE